MKKLSILLLSIIILGCTQVIVSNDSQNTINNDSQSIVNDSQTQIANPSATFCVEQGGTYDIRDEAGYCVFSDGSECPGWDYFNGDCAPGDSLITEFQASSPIAVYTAQDIESLGVDCSGSDVEIAECIYDWQASNMIYTLNSPELGPFNQPYPIRWQDILPGIFNSKDVIEQQVASNGKVYGICFDFAVVYCSIAEYYGLDCRVMETGSNLNEETRPGGMSLNEYNELKVWLDKFGLDYPYDAIRLAMPDESEVIGHYWAEVNLSEPSVFDDNGWRIVDASNQLYNGRSMTKDFIVSGEFNVVNRTAKDRSSIIENLTARINAGEDLSRVNLGNKTDLEEFLEGRGIYADDVEAGRVEEYVGVTDDLGNENRAAVIDDFMQGKALAPFYNDCIDVCSFFSGTISDCESMCEEEADYFSCYETCSGYPFYKVCDFVCDDEATWASCYEACCGEPLNLECDVSCAP